MTEDTLERYALGYLGEEETAAVEEHLLFCTACAELLEELEPAARLLCDALRQATPEIIAEHETSDGTITLTVYNTGKRWVGRVRGKTSDGGVLASTRQQAIISTEGHFANLFPEHCCNAQCTPARQRSLQDRVS